jgi:GT2 family glycosyltransferase
LTVHAVVVTFNRKALLTECLDALSASEHPVERIVVVDNASTDGTPDLLRERGYLDRPEIEYVRLDDNLGGAGGFAKGVEVAREHECDWLWLMDDDCEPRPDALGLLLAAPAATDPTTAALCGKVEKADGTLDFVHRGTFRTRMVPLPEAEYVPGRHRPIDYPSFVGLLVRTDLARRLDLPRADFFIWGDDVEYGLRLREHGDLVLVPESVMGHKSASTDAETPRSRALNRVLPVHFTPTPLERFWQNLFGLRNYVWIKRRYHGMGPAGAVLTALQFVAKHVLYDDRPLTRTKWIVRFARDGWRGRFVNIPPARWKEMVQRGEV